MFNLDFWRAVGQALAETALVLGATAVFFVGGGLLVYHNLGFLLPVYTGVWIGFILRVIYLYD